MTTDKEHLQWIHNRIVEVYGESENVDFLIRMRQIIDKQDTELNLHSVSHSTTPNYLDDKYEVKWLINNTYQVEQNGNCVYQGSESDCNEWLKCQLGYCG